MKKKLKTLLALAASIALIAIGQRSQNIQRDVRTQKAQVEDIDSEAWFI